MHAALRLLSYNKMKLRLVYTDFVDVLRDFFPGNIAYPYLLYIL